MPQQNTNMNPQEGRVEVRMYIWGGKSARCLAYEPLVQRHCGALNAAMFDTFERIGKEAVMTPM